MYFFYGQLLLIIMSRPTVFFQCYYYTLGKKWWWWWTLTFHWLATDACTLDMLPMKRLMTADHTFHRLEKTITPNDVSVYEIENKKIIIKLYSLVLQSVAEVTSRRRLRSASSSALVVPATRRSSLGRQSLCGCWTTCMEQYYLSSSPTARHLSPSRHTSRARIRLLTV